MITEAKKKIEEYETKNDVHQFKLVLDAASIFISSLTHGVSTESELEMGIRIYKNLLSVNMITSLHQYEYDYDLQNEILYKKLGVFRLCIPETHKALRGLTETLVGMSEGEMDPIIKTL